MAARGQRRGRVQGLHRVGGWDGRTSVCSGPPEPAALLGKGRAERGVGCSVSWWACSTRRWEKSPCTVWRGPSVPSEFPGSLLPGCTSGGARDCPGGRGCLGRGGRGARGERRWGSSPEAGVWSWRAAGGSHVGGALSPLGQPGGETLCSVTQAESGQW